MMCHVPRNGAFNVTCSMTCLLTFFFFWQGMTYLVVCCFCVYPIVWIVGSEGTAALGLSQQVCVHLAIPLRVYLSIRTPAAHEPCSYPVSGGSRVGRHDACLAFVLITPCALPCG